METAAARHRLAVAVGRASRAREVGAAREAAPNAAGDRLVRAGLALGDRAAEVVHRVQAQDLDAAPDPSLGIERKALAVLCHRRARRSPGLNAGKQA